MVFYAAENDNRFIAPQVNGDWANGMWFQNEDFLSYLGANPTSRTGSENRLFSALRGPPSRINTRGGFQKGL
jgi:hypothetical protein